ncbi:MAG: helix-turn-helix domain-containing protein [Actinobacteria bacterium]|nr:helix-turn-helix domain-containing protein [Actinomycetota bacterium]
MDVPTLQGIVDALAQELDLPVVLEDADQQPVVHSPHYGLTDKIRRDTIMRHATGEKVVDYFRHYDLPARADPFVVPGDPGAEVLPRLCIPVRHHDVALGYAWVLLPGGDATDDQLAAAGEAQEALRHTMRLEQQARAHEAEMVDDLVSADPDRRLRGLVNLEVKSAFDAPRRCVALVCAGPGWRAASARRAFVSQRWVPDPTSQLRGASTDEGVAVVAVDATPPGGPHPRTSERLEDQLSMPLDLPRIGRAVDELRRLADDAEVVIGVGPTVAAPSAVHQSYRRARLATRVALRTGRHRPVATWAALGVYRYLTQMPREALADGVDPRLLHLAENAPEIAGTLEVYLDHAAAIGEVADALHIHRSTLYYRLEKVAEVGIDLHSGHDRATMQAGFAALRLLQWWPTAQG